MRIGPGIIGKIRIGAGERLAFRARRRLDGIRLDAAG